MAEEKKHGARLTADRKDNAMPSASDQEDEPAASVRDRLDRKPYTSEPGRRAIRSFVLRQGRFSEAQQRAFDLQWPHYGLDCLAGEGQPRDFDAVFGRSALRVLEIGFGNGEALRYAAAHDPARDYIGIEVHAPGVGRLLNALAEDGSRNVRIYHHDAVEVLAREVAQGTLDEIRIYFPDPWHKKRHHKRRLLQPEFARLLLSRLRDGGRLHLATDWQDYAEQMWDVLDATPGLRNRAGPRGHVPRPDWRPQTHFESRGQRLGHGVWDLLYDVRR
jgi:tRNA (guanine-N7-)-methyltransferase